MFDIDTKTKNKYIDKTNEMSSNEHENTQVESSGSNGHSFFDIEKVSCTKTECTTCPRKLTASPHSDLTRIDLNHLGVLKPGDHIAWKRTYCICHHAIVEKVNAENKTLTIIHLAKRDPEILVHIKEIDCTKENGDLYRINYKENERFSPKETIERAKVFNGARFRSNNYCIFTNNCEHFATHCATGNCRSHQAIQVYRKAIISAVPATYTSVQNAKNARRDAITKKKNNTKHLTKKTATCENAKNGTKCLNKKTGTCGNVSQAIEDVSINKEETPNKINGKVVEHILPENTRQLKDVSAGASGPEERKSELFDLSGSGNHARKSNGRSTPLKINIQSNNSQPEHVSKSIGVSGPLQTNNELLLSSKQNNKPISSLEWKKHNKAIDESASILVEETDELIGASVAQNRHTVTADVFAKWNGSKPGQTKNEASTLFTRTVARTWSNTKEQIVTLDANTARRRNAGLEKFTIKDDASRAQSAVTQKVEDVSKQYVKGGEQHEAIQTVNGRNNASAKQTFNNETQNVSRGTNFRAGYSFDSLSNQYVTGLTNVTKLLIRNGPSVTHTFINGTLAVGASVLVKNSLSNGAKDIAKRSLTSAATITANKTTASVGKIAVEVTLKNLTKSAAEKTVSDGVKRLAEQTAKMVTKTVAKQTVENGVKEVAKQTASKVTQAAVKQTVENGVKEVAKQTAIKVTQVAVKQTVETGLKEVAKTTASAVTQAAAKQTASTGVKEVAKQTATATNAAVKQTMANGVQNAAKQTAFNGTEHAAKQAAAIGTKQTVANGTNTAATVSLTGTGTTSAAKEKIATKSADFSKQNVTNIGKETAGKQRISTGTLLTIGFEGVSTAWDIWDWYKNKIEGNISTKDFVESTTQRVTEGAFGVAGAVVGGNVGAAIGTFILPGIGTAIGSFVGSLAGDLFGRWCGTGIGSAIGKWFSSWW